MGHVGYVGNDGGSIGMLENRIVVLSSIICIYTGFGGKLSLKQEALILQGRVVHRITGFQAVFLLDGRSKRQTQRNTQSRQ